MTNLSDSIIRLFTEPMTDEATHTLAHEQFQDLLAARAYSIRVVMKTQAIADALREAPSARRLRRGR